MNSDVNDKTATLAENKVLILYLLISIDSDIRIDDLYNLATSINGIDYFIFKQILIDLINSKLAGTYTEDKKLIRITTEGKEAFKLTKEVLPGILKLKADSILKEQLPILKNSSSITADFIPKNENSFTVTCKIVEANETIFEVQSFVGSRERAKKIVDNWNANATKIYPQILNLLLNDYPQDSNFN